MKKIYIDVKYFFLNIGRSIRNLWRWFPIIWKDRDWDSNFIFDILKFKLKNTAEYTEQRKWFIGYEREVSRMRLCIKLIDLINKEHYILEYMDYETSIFEFIPTNHIDENGDTYHELKSEMIEDNLDKYFKMYPLMYKQVVTKLGSDSNRKLIALYIGGKNHERAKRLLFNILNKHIENWWD
jgi:hypothetical protein